LKIEQSACLPGGGRRLAGWVLAWPSIVNVQLLACWVLAWPSIFNFQFSTRELKIENWAA